MMVNLAVISIFNSISIILCNYYRINDACSGDQRRRWIRRVDCLAYIWYIAEERIEISPVCTPAFADLRASIGPGLAWAHLSRAISSAALVCV
jgi:hypothetical protein